MRKIKALVLFMPLLLVACSNNSTQDKVNLSDYHTIKLVTGSIQSSMDYVGVVEPKEQTIVSSKVGGRIIQLNADNGTYVQKGELLAKLDTTETQVNFQSAGQMQGALERMKQETQAMFDAQIKAMEQQVEQAKKAMELASLVDANNSIGVGGKQIEQSKLMSETKQAELEHTQQVLEQQEKTIYSNAKNALSQSKILFESIRTFVDELMGISLENLHKNDKIEAFLGAKNTSNKILIENKWKELDRLYTQLDPEIQDVLNIDVTTSLSGYQKDKIYKVLIDTKELMDGTREMLDILDEILKDSITSSYLTRAMLDSYKQANVEYQNGVEAVLLTAQGNFLLGIKGSIQAIDNFKKESAMKLDLLTKQEALAATQYEVTKANLTTQYEVAKKQYQQALAGLDALKKQKEAQLAQINTQIVQAQGNKNMAGVQINNSQVLAPFEGVIIKKMANYGQVVGPGTPIFVLGTNKSMKVTILVPEQKIQTIKLGDKALIKFKSLGKTFTGVVSKIAPMADLASHKIPVEVDIIDPGVDIKLGIYATVSFLGNNLTGILVPIDYIKYEFGNAYVNILQKNKIKKVYVDIIECQDRQCLISEDSIKAGDTIIQD